MNKNPLVSAIIPAYNEERYIGKCLKSLLNQTYRPLEIIVVDDGSTDSTIQVVKKYKVKLCKQKHKGPASARNLGAFRSKGKILVFPDADIKYDEKYLEILIKPIIERKVIGTFNNEEYVANIENIWSNCWAINSDLPINRRNTGQLPKYLPVFRAILKKEFDRVQGFDNTGYADDVTISRKLGIKALRVKGAKAYHYNPETLKEIFFSARFIGRERDFFKPNFFNLLRFSPFNSTRIAVKKIIKEKVSVKFLLFKLIYDFGILSGIFFSFGAKSK